MTLSRSILVKRKLIWDEFFEKKEKQGNYKLKSPFELLMTLFKTQTIFKHVKCLPKNEEILIYDPNEGVYKLHRKKV